MTILRATTGRKKVIIREGQNGYGEEVFRAALTQDFFNGLEDEERFISSKEASTEKKAFSWAKKQLL
jgi:hypothetical protein